MLNAALEHIGERADSYTTHTEGTGRDSLVSTLLDEIQDDPAVHANSAAWGELRGCAVFDQTLRPTLGGLVNQWNTDVASLIRQGQADGSIPGDLDADELAPLLTALTEGLSSRWLAGILTTRSARVHLAAAAETFLEGAMRPGRSPAPI